MPADLVDLRTGITIVTGTDTDVGKTVATAVLAAHLAGTGVDLALVKPAQTGLEPGAPGDVHQAGSLAGLAGDRLHELVRLPEPLAPTTAGRRAGIDLPPVASLARSIAALADGHEALLVEGAGGILVGLDAAGAGLLELADELESLGRTPRFVVVTRSGLGTLNHTGLTCRAVRDRGHEVTGIVVGAWPAQPDLAERCNLEEIEDAAGAPLLAVLPAGIGSNASAVRAAAAAL